MNTIFFIRWERLPTNKQKFIRRESFPTIKQIVFVGIPDE